MWAVVGLLPRREALALQCLDFRGFTTYFPRIRQRRIVRGRRVETTPPLFPGYAFISIESQWHAARWSPGVLSLIMDGAAPARVPDNIIADIRAREHNGLVTLPPQIKRGDRVRIERGPFEGVGGLYIGQAPRDRVLVLLSLLGASREIALPAGDVTALR